MMKQKIYTKIKSTKFSKKISEFILNMIIYEDRTANCSNR